MIKINYEKDFNGSIQIASKAIKLHHKHNFEEIEDRMRDLFYNIGLCYFHTNKLTKSLNYFYKAFNIDKSLNDTENIFKDLNWINKIKNFR